jgi:hypothetical protein
VMDRLNFTTSKGYELYEEGTSVIRADRLEDWAAAFGLSVEQFVAEVITGTADPTLRERAVAAIGESWAEQMPETADVMARELGKLPPAAREQVLAEVEAARRGLPCERVKP